MLPFAGRPQILYEKQLSPLLLTGEQMVGAGSVFSPLHIHACL